MALYNQSERVYLKLEVNNKELVTDWTNLVYFKMTEYAGLALTYFSCCFRTFDKAIADLVVTNNIIKATIGDDPNLTDTFEIKVAKADKNTGGVDNQYMVVFSGTVGNPQFLVDTRSEYYNGTSIDVIKQFYNNYLKNKITNNIISDIQAPSGSTDSNTITSNSETTGNPIKVYQDEVNNLNSKIKELEIDISAEEGRINGVEQSLPSTISDNVINDFKESIEDRDYQTVNILSKQYPDLMKLIDPVQQKNSYEQQLSECKKDLTTAQKKLKSANKQKNQNQSTDKKELSNGATIVQETPMTWYRTNQAGNMFLVDVWMHMNIFPSFPLMAIDKYNNLIIKDYDKIQASQPKWNFVGNSRLANYQAGDILFLNNFNVKSYKEMSNMYSGYGKLVSVANIDSGKYGIFSSDTDKSLLSNSQVTENNNYGTNIKGAIIDSGNVYDGYNLAYFYNTSKIVDLSSYEGMVQLSGKYFKDLKPLDLVNVMSGRQFIAIEGKYLIDTIEVMITPNKAIQTKVYVCRDNLNNLENSLNIEEIKRKMLIPNSTKRRIMQTLKNMREVVSSARRVVNGIFLSQVTGFIKELKYSLLSDFNVYGYHFNLNSKNEALVSLIYNANKLGNTIIDSVLDPPFNMLFHDIILRRPSSIEAVLQQIYLTVLPVDVQDIISQMLSLFAEVSYLMQDIKKKNEKRVAEENLSNPRYIQGQKVKVKETVEDGVTEVIYEKDDTDMTNDERAQQVINETVENIEDKTQGVDIPIPIIDLTDSEKLMNNDKIQELIVDKVISNLEDKGYLDNISTDEINTMKNIFLGSDTAIQIPVSIKQQINNNVGNKLYTRYWGTFSDLTELTEFYIEGSFKEVYKTVDVTKLINAVGGKRIFIAIPKEQVNKRLRFYINNVNVTTDIGVNAISSTHPLVECLINSTDKQGIFENYRVFYTDKVYNSNSVLFEMRQI